MAKILCLETATVNCSVAVFIDGNEVCCMESNTGGYSHSENLHVFIRSVMERASLSMTDLDAVAVSKGPGSYTGLRIGVSGAKGLAYALDIPVLGVDTLRLMAMEAREKAQADIYVPMIDARRMEVYTSVYDAEMNMLHPVAAQVVDAATYDFLPADKTICFCGDGMPKCREMIHHPHAVYADEVFPSARMMGGEAERLYAAHEWEDVAYFEPYYLKDFVGGGKNK